MEPATDYPRVSILICTYNRCTILKRCLESIIASDYSRDLLELIVLDDASSDSTAIEIPRYFRYLERQFSIKTIFLRNQQNLGIAAGRWLLGKRVPHDSEMAFFVDDDVYLSTKCLKVLVEYMLRCPRVGIIGPRIVYANNPQLTAHSANFVGRWTCRYWSKDSSEPLVCDWVYSICCLVKKEVIDMTGGFYSGYYTAHEEVDFCLRAKKAGFKVVYYPGVNAQHKEEIGQLKRERLYYLYRNKLILIHRNFSFIPKVIAISLIILFGLPKYIIDSIKFHKKLVFSELRLVFLSLWHGVLRRGGRLAKE